MNERDSRGSRRRRWWLRAWSEQKRHRDAPSQAAGTGIAATGTGIASVVTTSAAPALPLEETLGQEWLEEFRKECRIPAGVLLVLKHRDRGTRLRMPLSRSLCLIGSAEGCDIELPAEEVTPREALLVWVAGTLYVVSLSFERPFAVDAAGRSSRWHWGGWDVTVAGLPRTGVQPPSVAELDLQFSTDDPATESGTPIPGGLSFLANHAGQLVPAPVPEALPELALLIRTPQRLWLLNPFLSDRVRVNNRTWRVCSLDAGDTVTQGPTSAQLTIRWPDLQAPNVGKPDVAPETATSMPDWEQFLLDQAARLAQLQQSLQELSRGPENAAQNVERRVLLEQIQTLAMACARDAAAVNAEQAAAPCSGDRA